MKSEIDGLIEKIAADNKKHLSLAMDRSKDLSVYEYSKKIHSYRADSQIEPALLAAIKEELHITGYTTEQITKTLQSIESRRTIQTAHHTEIVPTSRMFCIDWISTRALDPDEPYIVGDFSGVPFSNKSRPGRLHAANEEINFVPKTHQDSLVYSANVFEKTMSQYDNLPEPLRNVLPEPRMTQKFPHWAARCHADFCSKVLDRTVIAFDINRVAMRYLLKVLPNPEHPLSKILLDPKWTRIILNTFDNRLHFFYSPYRRGKYAKQENLYYMDGIGFGSNRQTYPNTAAELMTALANEEICPGAFLVFTIFAFMNDFQCLGSFVQAEYLPRFRKSILSTGLLSHRQKHIENIPASSLTTGMFPGDPYFAPVTIITKDAPIPAEMDNALGDFYLPIWRGGEYYTNKQAS